MRQLCPHIFIVKKTNPAAWVFMHMDSILFFADIIMDTKVCKK